MSQPAKNTGPSLESRLRFGATHMQGASFGPEECAELLALISQQPPENRLVRIGLNEDGTMDEVVTQGVTHVEQLDDGCWYVGAEPIPFSFFSESPITSSPRDYDSWPEALAALNPEQPSVSQPPQPPGWRFALECIAAGECSNPQHMAKAALEGSAQEVKS